MTTSLPYLFEAQFHDGTILQQTQEDTSLIDPSKNAFFDVIQRLEEVDIFGIFNDTQSFVVDLHDGHFEINGVPFFLNGITNFLPGAKFRLVYFHRHHHTVTVGQSESDHVIEFHIGWQSNTVDGSNVQQTINTLGILI